MKPAAVGVVPFDILKKRLLRGTPTAEVRRLVYGESAEAIGMGANCSRMARCLLFIMRFSW